MKLLSLIVPAMFLMSFSWRTDFSKAKDDAANQHKLILLKFSGSDWCVPCIRMEKNIFSKDAFAQYADSNLVMINADFPRLKKNQPSKDVVKQNEALAEQYDKEGSFPLTVLLSPDGKVLKRWEGDPAVSPEEFVTQIKSVQNADN